MPEKLDPKTNPSLIDERLLQLTTENAELKAQLAQSEKDKEMMQVDFSNKIANAKVENDSKVLILNRQIHDLHKQLEARTIVENRIARKGKKSVNQIYEEAFGD